MNDIAQRACDPGTTTPAPHSQLDTATSDARAMAFPFGKSKAFRLTQSRVAPTSRPALTLVCSSAMTRKLATYADLLALPEGVRAEVIAGEVVTQPSPLPRHSKVLRAVGRFLGGPFDDDDGHGGPGGWWIFVEVDVVLGEHEIVQPDLAGWRRERLPRPGTRRPIEVVPDWVCEILSPSTSARDRVTKRALYARSGVAHYWMIDPEARVLEALSLRDGVWVVVGVYDDTATARIAPFDAIELELGRLYLPKYADE
jgi:Uma2 family endonuclease